MDTIDIVADQHMNYVKEEDMTVFISKKTGRGPLSNDWIKEYSDAIVVRQTLGYHVYISIVLGTDHANKPGEVHDVRVQVVQGGVQVLGDAEQAGEIHP